MSFYWFYSWIFHMSDDDDKLGGEWRRDNLDIRQFYAATVLQAIYDEPVYLQSDFARDYDKSIAWLASDGLISNMDPITGGPTRKWHITDKGLAVLWKL